MNIFLWILLGATLGTLGHLIDRSPAKGGLIGAIFFGITGALLGGLSALLLFGTATSPDFSVLLIVLSGGLVLLLLQRTLLSQQRKF